MRSSLILSIVCPRTSAVPCQGLVPFDFFHQMAKMLDVTTWQVSSVQSCFGFNSRSFSFVYTVTWLTCRNSESSIFLMMTNSPLKFGQKYLGKGLCYIYFKNINLTYSSSLPHRIEFHRIEHHQMKVCCQL